MKRILISVTSDISTDRRVLKVAQSCHNNGLDVKVFSRKPKNCLPIHLPFKYKQLNLIFNRSALLYAEYNIRLFFVLLFSKVDILLSNDTDTLLANYLVSKIRNKKLVFDAHEIFPELPELAHRPKVKWVWKKIEDWIFPHLKHCYTVCQSVSDYYNDKYNIQMKVVRNLPYDTKNFNCKERKRFTQRTQNIELKEYSLCDLCEKSLRLCGKKPFDTTSKIILYQGALNIGRGLEWIIDAMPLVEHAVLVIIGDGDITHELKERVNHLNLNDKVFFLGRISGMEISKYTPSADLGLCLLENRGLNYYYSLPNRIFDYLQAGVPVLATDFPEIAQIVNTYNTGILVNHYEPQYLAEVINNFFAKGFDTAHFAETAAKFRWEEEEKILLEVIVH